MIASLNLAGASTFFLYTLSLYLVKGKVFYKNFKIFIDKCRL